MKPDTAVFIDHTRAIGADLCGIAPIARFADVPASHHPSSIFPEAKSVVVLGKRITRGALRGVEEGTQMQNYHLYGLGWLTNRILATLTFKTCEVLEDAGWEAVPLQDLPPETPPMGVPVRPGQPAPNVMVDVIDAAVRAGLGEIGTCGLLLTPQYGPRQRFQLVLTDAELDPTPPLAGPVCVRCADLSAVCPLGAITAEGLNTAVCRTCQNGALPNPAHPAGQPDRLGALCARTCVQALEDAGRLENRFARPFRARAPWGVVIERRGL